MQSKVLIIFIGLLFYGSLGMAQNFNKDILPRYNRISVGLGPSFMYADNAGGVRNFTVKFRPSASVSYEREISSFLELKGTVGYQMLESQTPTYYSDSALINWNEAGQAFAMKGHAYYIDVMPVFHVFPYDTHINRTTINIYAGIGIGVMGVNKEEVRLVLGEPNIQEKSMALAYIPIRGGLSYRIGPHSDLSFEATLLTTFSDSIDGNEGYNRFNDLLFQGQVVYKRYLSPFPFWSK